MLWTPLGTPPVSSAHTQQHWHQAREREGAPGRACGVSWNPHQEYPLKVFLEFQNLPEQLKYPRGETQQPLPADPMGAGNRAEPPTLVTC